MSELQFLAAVGGALLLLLGTFLTVMVTRGKTQADYKTAFDKRIDDKMMSYTEGLEKRVAAAEKKASDANSDALVLKTRVDDLDLKMEESTHREKVSYRYIARLRDHIIAGLKPPPPAIPEELVEWYESFEAGTGLA